MGRQGNLPLRNIGENAKTWRHAYEVQELDEFTINLRINFALYD